MVSPRAWRYFMFLVAFATGIPPCIQAFEIWVTGDHAGVSLLAFTVQAGVNASWWAHGIRVKDKPIWLASIIGLSGAASTLLGILIL